VIPGHLIDRNAVQEFLGPADPQRTVLLIQDKKLLLIKVANETRGGGGKNRYQLLRASCRELLKRQALNTITII